MEEDPGPRWLSYNLRIIAGAAAAAADQ